jgi:uncharacterized membrane protein
VLALGAGFRFGQITKFSQWPDEFWSSVYLASARGNQIFQLPVGKLLNPPPSVALPGAPAWWHIWWHGMDTVSHPPLYPIVLRWWEDLFGESDFATRTFSAVMSLAGIVLLFDLIRREFNPNVALIASALMAVAVSQIDYSQEARPYTFMALEALWACHVLLRMEKFGASHRRLVEFSAAVVCLQLTHYMSAGAIAALGIYALIRLRGRDRRKTLVIMASVCILAFIAWYPFLWIQRGQFSGQGAWTTDSDPNRLAPLWHALEQPAFHLFGNQPGYILPIAVIVYLLPVVLSQWRKRGLLLWLMVVGTIGSVTAYDLIHHTKLLSFERYTLLCTPMLCALVSLPLGRSGLTRWILPSLMLLAAGLAVEKRWQEGPPLQADWRGLMTNLNNQAGPDEPIIFSYDSRWLGHTIWYIGFGHYAPDSRRPVMMLDAPVDSAALAQLAAFKHIWLVGPNAHSNAATILPGWKSSGQVFGTRDVGEAALLVPDHPVTEAR